MIVGIGSLGELSLANQHCPCVFESSDDGSVLRRKKVTEHRGARSSRHVLGPTEILYGYRDAVKRTANATRCNLPIRLIGLRQRALFEHVHKGMQFRVQFRYARKH